jgi:hypothetical protein
MRGPQRSLVSGSGAKAKVLLVFSFAAVALVVLAQPAAAKPGSFIGGFTRIDTVASTVPANGDINPYGVAVVPANKGSLVKGDVLVSNFNDSGNAQGTGTTIVQVSPHGTVTLFSALDPTALPGACPGGVGLTTALTVLKSGWVIVGSLPTSDGTSATAQAGCLIVLNSKGQAVMTISGAKINGPWDSTALDRGNNADVFVTNVLDGTVVRIDVTNLNNRHHPRVSSETTIATGFAHHADPAALEVGPTGLGLSTNGTLYVADSAANRIASIGDAAVKKSASRGVKTVSSDGSLNDPLGLAVAPNGDILTTNGGDGNLVETTRAGKQVAVATLDDTPVQGEPNGNGTLFGLALTPRANGIYFVDDGSNTLNLFH